MKETTYTDLLEAAVTQGATIKTILADIEILKKLKAIVVKNRNSISQTYIKK